ncbi:MAG: RagB/SusD family nutrient uptake outer membrane protein [Flavobacteriaceae bacterium]
MKTIIKQYQSHFLKGITFATMSFLMLLSCSDFLEPDDPFGQIPYVEIFEDEATAIAAVTTLYAKLRDDVLLTGNSSGLSVRMGLYADELDFYGMPGESAFEIYQHQIIASNSAVQSTWNSTYNLIHMANAALEGLEKSEALSQNLKNQLRGESLFIRAFSHVHLLNLFGNIPYITTTDFQVNKDVSRLPQNTVYEFILTDLNEAKTLLDENYIGEERTRVNKAGISALLARVHLYRGNWQEAEAQCNSVINNTALYSLEPNIENEFLINSNSAILQFKPKNFGTNTHEASTFIFISVPPPFLALTNSLVEAFEENDLRRTHWIGELSDDTQTWYHAHKYKATGNTGMSLEYSIVFRLAEIYLIRAEARAMQNNLQGALQDLNTIRARAGLENAVAGSQSELITAILNERRFELFTEHGHRWFDIKRLNRASQILSPIKPGWRETNTLWPIPEADLLINPNLQPQNPGY